MSVCSEVSISGRVHPRTIVNIVYSVHRHVRVSRVVDVCDVSIQCPYTDVIVFAMYMTRAVNIVYRSSYDYTVPGDRTELRSTRNFEAHETSKRTELRSTRNFETHGTSKGTELRNCLRSSYVCYYT